MENDLDKGNVNMCDQRLFACEHCFKDNYLRELIRENDKKGDCLWCGSKDVYIIPITEIGHLFRDVVAAMYEENTTDTGGDDIAYLLQGDWEIFSETIEETPDNFMRCMTVEILKAGLGDKDYFTNYPDYSSYFQEKYTYCLEEEWENRITDLLTRHSCQGGKGLTFTESEDELSSRIEIALEDFVTDYEKDQVFYRARIHKERSRKNRFTPIELGAPPPDKTLASRANREGEPVLYLSSNAQTALSEVRAWKGAAVAIAKMRLRRQLFVVNLLNFKLPDSPFSEENLEWRLQLTELFQGLAEELSRPVMPHEQNQLYLSSQHLCDLIKKSRYDGLVYPSSMGQGYNVVLFNPEDAELINDVTYFRVKEISFQTNVLEEHDEIYEELPWYYHLQK